VPHCPRYRSSFSEPGLSGFSDCFQLLSSSLAAAKASPDLNPSTFSRQRWREAYAPASPVLLLARQLVASYEDSFACLLRPSFRCLFLCEFIRGLCVFAIASHPAFEIACLVYLEYLEWPRVQNLRRSFRFSS
jgi:hypothetical protein